MKFTFTPFKKAETLLIVFIALFLVGFTATSYGQEKSNKKMNEASQTLEPSKTNGYGTIAKKQDSWVMVQNQNGIKSFLKEEVLPEGRFIAIKFENDSAKEMSFSWELNLNGISVQKSSFKITLKGKTAEIFFDPTIMVKLEDKQSVNQFSITTF